MVPSTEIPTEIWLNIASFLPRKALQNLLGVNRHFFDLACSELYKVVHFTKLESLDMTIKRLEHLGDPRICSHIRCLELNVGLFYSTGKLVVSRYSANVLENIRQKQRINALMVDIVLKLGNLTSFILLTYEHLDAPSLEPFLSAAWKTFAHNLCALRISAPLEEIEGLLPAPADLKAVKEITFSFFSEWEVRGWSVPVNSVSVPANTEQLSNVVAPFLRAVSPRLQSLNITSHVSENHSVLFHGKGCTSNKLTSVRVAFPLYPPTLGDSSGLAQFLNENAETLKHVSFSDLEKLPSTLSPQRVQWIRNNPLRDLRLRNLVTLTIKSGTLLHILGSPNSFIQPSKDTLTKLTLSGLPFSFTELTALATSFAHRRAERGLKHIKIQLVSLSPQVFDLFAKWLIGLEQVTLNFKFLLSNALDETAEMSDAEEPEEQDTGPFLAEMAKRTYKLWKLRLWCNSLDYEETQDLRLKILSALRAPIPSAGFGA